MINVGVLNALMVRKQVLTEPKTLGEIRDGLFRDQRERGIPFLLAGGLEDFIEDEIRDKTILVIDGTGTDERYQVNPTLAVQLRTQIDDALHRWRTISVEKARNGNRMAAPKDPRSAAAG